MEREIVRRYVSHFTRTYRVPYDAVEDITQEVMLSLWQSGNANHRGYAYTSCRNKVLNHIKHKSRKCRDSRKRVPLNDEIMKKYSDSMDSIDLLAQVQETLLSMGTKGRVLTMWSEGYSAQQIADYIGVSDVTIYRLMDKARARLKKIYKGGVQV